MNYSANIKITNGDYLRSAGRNLKAPFCVDIRSEGGKSELLCTGILRFLPGKRLVCSGKWKDLNVVAKFFLDSKNGRRHFAREERGIKALAGSGVPTPALLLSGVAMPGGVPLLCFEEITGSVDIRDIWDKAESDGVRIDILKELMTVTARQHMSGISQEDPHIRNFILSGETIYAVDGDAVDTGCIGKPLSLKTSLKNLGLFFAQFYPLYANLIRDAFYAYASVRNLTRNGDLYECLMKEVKKSRDKAEKEYLKKVFRESTSFVCDKNPRRFMVCAREHFDDNMKVFLEDPEAHLSGCRIIKDGNSSTVFLVSLSGRPVVIKRYNMKNMWHALRRSYRKSRAWTSWRSAHLLTSVGINTPRPVAMMEKRFGPLRSVSYILNEYVCGTDLYHLLNSACPDKTDFLNLAVRLGEMLKKFAFSSISHGDFKATNFILSDKGELFIADLDAVKKHRSEIKFKKSFGEDLSRFMQNWKNSPRIESLFKNEISKLYDTMN
jgi:tRNA A-37 threonylcarbamoyl transferase component Bud32